MKKAAKSKKALLHFVLAVVLILGVMLSFNSAFADEGMAGSTETTTESTSEESGQSADTIDATATTSAEDNPNAVAVTAAATPTVTITNNFTNDGTYVATAAGVPEGTKYVWQRSANGSSWTDVVATKVTGDSYNVDKDATKAMSINIALDSKVISNSATDTTLFSYRVQLRDENGNVLATSNVIKNTYYTQLQNGGFENPDFSDGRSAMSQVANGAYPQLIWLTTGLGKGDKLGRDIEIINSSGWHEYEARRTYNGATAHSGKQFAELNCEASGSLYQDVMTVPGSTLYWQLYHRARANGEDTMYVLIMPRSSGKDITTQADVYRVMNNLDQYPGAQVEDITDGNSWVEHDGNYTVPTGQYLTRFFFVAGNTASGDDTVGNFLDDVWFSRSVPPANPDSGNVTVTKTVSGLPADILKGYVVTVTLFNSDHSYTHTFNSNGWDANGSQSFTFTNVPGGTYTVSETVVPEGVSLSDYNETRTGAPATVTVEDQSSSTVNITNSYTKKTANLTISKTVKGNMGDKTQEFGFTLKVDGGYSENLVDTGDDNIQVQNKGNGTYSFNLTDGQAVTVSLPYGTTYTITEDDPNKQGDSHKYKTTYAVDGGTATEGLEYTATSDITSDTTVAFTNNKSMSSPDVGVNTGSSLPYAVGLGSVAAGAAFLLAKRRRGIDR